MTVLVSFATIAWYLNVPNCIIYDNRLSHTVQSFLTSLTGNAMYWLLFRCPSSLSPVRRGSQRLSERRWAGRPPPNVADSLAVCRAPGRPVSSARWAAGSAMARQPIGPARPSASDRQSAVDWPAAANGAGRLASLPNRSCAAAHDGERVPIHTLPDSSRPASTAQGHPA